MTDMNNLDVIILIIVGISALIAYSRGLIKEVLSIVGWILGCIAVIYLLPILNPITMEYVKNGTFAGVLTAVAILILFLVCWVLFTAKIVGKVRTSKLGGLDRMLGLFFGIARACLLIILCYILIGWVVPPEKQSPILQESKYYTLAGTFADPIENLIPEETLEKIKNSSFLSTPKKEKASEEKTIEENKVKEKAHKIEKEKEQEKTEQEELFNKLTQPKIKKKNPTQKAKENFDGYKKNERADLDRLIENIEE